MSFDKVVEKRQEFFESLFIVTKTLLDNSKTKKILFKDEKEFIEGAFKDAEEIEELYYSACNALERTIDLKN
ncbi:MAG: hypothetical protein J6J60_06705 [Clostridia bacterium]|nr:hypothetical protein [Clostridia bacterium]